MTFNAIVDHDGWNSQMRENAARGAWAWGTAHSTGWGEVVIKKPIMFGLTFVTVPFVSYGFELENDNQLEDDRFPRCSGGVVRWVKDKRDFYLGAHVMVTVATADPIQAAVSLHNEERVYVDTQLDYDITHHFTFFGLGIKDITASDFKD